MTARDAIGTSAARLHARLDEVLDSEDAVIALVDRAGTTTICHGFGASGCQLELLANLLDSTIRAMTPPVPRPAGEREEMDACPR
jgi:hypothetical protein